MSPVLIKQSIGKVVFTLGPRGSSSHADRTGAGKGTVRTNRPMRSTVVCSFCSEPTQLNKNRDEFCPYRAGRQQSQPRLPKSILLRVLAGTGHVVSIPLAFDPFVITTTFSRHEERRTPAWHSTMVHACKKLPKAFLPSLSSTSPLPSFSSPPPCLEQHIT